jgi:hypothetical protein
MPVIAEASSEARKAQAAAISSDIGDAGVVHEDVDVAASHPAGDRTGARIPPRSGYSQPVSRLARLVAHFATSLNLGEVAAQPLHLVDDHPELGKGLDIARDYGVADLGRER